MSSSVSTWNEWIQDQINTNPLIVFSIVLLCMVLFCCCTFWITDISALGCLCIECYDNTPGRGRDLTAGGGDSEMFEDLEEGGVRIANAEGTLKRNDFKNQLTESRRKLEESKKSKSFKKERRRESRRRRNSVAKGLEKMVNTKVRVRGFTVDTAVKVTRKPKDGDYCGGDKVDGGSEEKGYDMSRLKDNNGGEGKYEDVETDWAVVHDSTYKQDYYTNSQTGEKQWEKPVGVQWVRRDGLGSLECL